MSGVSHIFHAFSGTFDWTGRTGRGPFAIAFVLYIGLFFIGVTVFDGWAGLSIFLAVATFAYVGQLRRRMRDAGWAGGWMWAALVPYLGLILNVILMFRKSTEQPRNPEPAILRKAGWTVALLFCVLVAARGWIYEPFWSPSGSMKPTLMPGDYYLSVALLRAPQRGDVVVFEHPETGSEFVHRIIGLGGDTVQMADGQVILNGAPLPQAKAPDFVEVMAPQGPHGGLPRCANGPVGLGEACIKQRFVETLPSGQSYSVLDVASTSADNTTMFTVPAGHMFVLGDNRDNALDSRMAQIIGGIGFVPLENVKGRVSRIMFSFTGDISRVFKRVP